jgi:hypothetical protein
MHPGVFNFIEEKKLYDALNDKVKIGNLIYAWGRGLS